MGPQGGRTDAVRNHSGVVCNKVKIIKAEWEISTHTEKSMAIQTVKENS